ncbi:MAG: AIR synthase family protein [Candidatus Thermoplasmatota archaeon]|nr:AIR synthase family protein [Candidatus Thermoplasmatota archaeon]
MELRTGKLPPTLLKRLLKNTGASDRRVLLGPTFGEDAAVVRLGKQLLVLKSDPVTYASDMIGWYAVNVNANDIVTKGAVPAWFQAVILLPVGSDEALAESIFKQISAAAKKLGIAVTGGHTEVTPGIDHPIVVGDMHGVVEGRHIVRSSGARVGDALVLTKGAGIEGTAVIAREKRADLLKVFDESFVNRAAKYLFRPGLSIVAEAKVALKYRVSAMHDPTEGGVAMGVHELAEASGKSVELWTDEIIVRKETARLCAKYGLNPLGLLGSGALLATFKPSDSDKFVAEVHTMGIDASVVGKMIAGPGKSRMVSSEGITPLSFSERDEVLKVLSP